MARLQRIVGLRRLRRFGRHQGGFAATEFAVLFPFMLVLYLGTIAVTDVVTLDRKSAAAARTAADLASQLDLTVQGGKCQAAPPEVNGVLGAAGKVVAPYPPEPLKVVVSCIRINQGGGATVMWSRSSSGTGRSGSITPPAGLADSSATTYWVLGEATYTYEPPGPLGELLQTLSTMAGYGESQLSTGGFDLSEAVYMRARR